MGRAGPGPGRRRDAGGRWIYTQECTGIWCTDEDGKMIQPIRAEEDGDWIADARTRLPVALDALAAVLALHQPTSCVGVQCEEHTCTGTDDKPCQDADPYGQHELPACGDCGVAEYGYADEITWPCPTVRAITAALTVRAWDLRAAMREGGRVLLPAWVMDEDPDDPRHDYRQENNRG